MRKVQRGLVGSTILLVAAGLTTAHAGSAHHSVLKHVTKTLKIVTGSGGKYAFRPKTVTIARGTKITWRNVSHALHIITSKKAGQFNKQIGAGKTVSITFKKAGIYQYFCSIHPYMHGKIVVKKRRVSRMTRRLISHRSGIERQKV